MKTNKSPLYEAKKSIEEELNKFYKKILAKKTIRLALYITYIFFYPGIILAVIIADTYGVREYNIFENYISDLGTSLYTPAPYLFNAILIATGVAFIPIYFYLEEVIVKNPDQVEKLQRNFKIMKIFAKFGKIFFLVGSIAMIGAGFFNEHYRIHAIFAMFLFGGLILGGFSTGIIIIVRKSIIPTILGYIMLLSSMIFLILNILKFLPFFTPYFIEWCTFLSIVLWFFPTTITLLKYQDKCIKACLN